MQRASVAAALVVSAVVLLLLPAAVMPAHGMGVDRAEAAREADADANDLVTIERAPMPPPPPYASVMLQIEEQIKNAEKEAGKGQNAEAANTATRTTANAKSNAAIRGGQRIDARAAAAGSSAEDSASASRMRAKLKLKSAAHSRSGSGDPFPDQPFTYKDVSSPPDWLVPEESEPAGPTTKPPPVPQMIPPPPPVPFPTYNYHDPNSAGPFSQYAPGVQGWGYDGGYAGPYDGYSLYGYHPNPAEGRGWLHPNIPRTAAQIASATAASQYHPYGAPPPLYALGSPPPDGAASWVPIGAYLKPGTLEGGAGEED